MESVTIYIAYFDLDEKLELTIDARFIKNRAINYVKLMPTAFRRKPLNFSSKAFNSN